MPRIKFTKNFTFVHSPQSHTDYKEGAEEMVTTPCADAAIAAGAAKPVKKQDEHVQE